MHEKVVCKKNNHQGQLNHLSTTEKAGKGRKQPKFSLSRKPSYWNKIRNHAATPSKNYMKLFNSSHQCRVYGSSRKRVIFLRLI